MRRNAGRQLSRWVTLLAMTAATASGQNAASKEVKVCPAGTDFETEQYRILQAPVEDPFKFLYWGHIHKQFAAMVENQPFTYQRGADGLQLLDSVRSAPDSRTSFAVSYEFVKPVNCDSNAKTLDLMFVIYSTDPPKFLGGATEAQATAEKSPQTTAGLTQAGSPFHFTPAGGYNRSDGLFGGGRLDITPQLGKFRLFDTFTAEGHGSYSTRFVSVALSGSANLLGWVKHTDWRLNYLNNSAPAGATRLQEGSLSAQFDGASRPFWNSLFLARFGGLLEGGNLQSNAPGSLLAPQTLPSAGYGSLKGYVGLSSTTSNNAFSVSYGLQLGSVGPSTQIDWRKHIGDVVDDFWIAIGDHKSLEVESRFTTGGIQIPHSIPLPERFFGGNDAGYFIPGDSWQISDVPVIRAIPANRFYLTGEGAGADRFASINLTVSYPVYAKPIVPKVVTDDPKFQTALSGAITSATSVEQNYYVTKDTNFATAMKQLPHLQQLLDALQGAVTTAQAANPGQFPDAFGDCTDNIAGAEFYLTNALAPNANVGDQYGNLSALLPVDPDDALQSIHDACVGELSQQLNDPGIQKAAADVDAARAVLLQTFNNIDQKGAAQKAANDIAFASRTLQTLLNDLNIYSISPVAVFDSAWLGPAKGALGGNRIGPGGGIRLELASYVNFTLGYAWNVNRQPGEGKGALFFSIGIRDLFH